MLSVAEDTRDGFLGIGPRWASLALWLCALEAFYRLAIWSWPQQPAYLAFLISITAGIFALALWQGAWALFALLLVVPGITTATLTVFNYVQPQRQLGVFGPAALMPACGFILGVWLRAWWRREAEAPNRLRAPLLLFCALSIISAALALWRYTDFWPFGNRPYLEQTVNCDGIHAGQAIPGIIWALANYLTGPLLFISICHVAHQWRTKRGRLDARLWLGLFIVLPLLIGSAAPVAVGLHQIKDVWFGANRTYIWPWMNRINATFFDPNALGSFLVLYVPWICAAVGLLAHVRGWLLLPALPCAAALLYASGLLMSSSGSRTALVGVGLCVVAAVFLGLLHLARRLARGRGRWAFPLAVTGLVCLFAATDVLLSSVILPATVTWIKSQPRLHGKPLLKRIDQLPFSSLKQAYQQIVADRGPYARIALGMIRDVPLAGVGLGTFVTELGNWKKKENILIYIPDTACNYYLQIAAEQGVVAALLMLGVFGLWWWRWWRVLQRERAFFFWLFVGAGMASMEVVFLFGMHTLAAEIQCLFWIFFSQPFVADDEPMRAPPRMSYVWLLACVVGGMYMGTATARLSLRKQRQEFGWYKTEGFYGWETWHETGVPRMRYTGLSATDMLACEGILFRQQWACRHPDIGERPVRVTFTLGSATTNIVVGDNEWHVTDMVIPWSALDSLIAYRIGVDRTWNPMDWGVSNDLRALGVSLGEATWSDAVGFYDKETWPQDGRPMAGQEYHWAAQAAQLLVRSTTAYVRVPILITHPNLSETPVVLSITVNDTLATNVVWTTNGWQDVLLFCRPKVTAVTPPERCYIGFHVSRTWEPAYEGVPDLRELGFAVGPYTQVPFGGLGPEEQEQQEQQLVRRRWAGEEARWAQQADYQGRVTIRCLIDHPDMRQNPVEWKLYANGPLVEDVFVSDNGWQTATVWAQPFEWVDLRARVDRTWCPKDYGMPDPRQLGFAVRP